MQVSDAVEFLNNLVMKPGWTLHAEDGTRRYENGVKVTLTEHTFHTEVAFAPAYEDGGMFDAYATWMLQVGKDDRVSLTRKVLDCIADFNSHEWREFLRYGDTLEAPFHPHREEGMQRWGNEEGDRHYGLA